MAPDGYNRGRSDNRLDAIEKDVDDLYRIARALSKEVASLNVAIHRLTVLVTILTGLHFYNGFIA